MGSCWCALWLLEVTSRDPLLVAHRDILVSDFAMIGYRRIVTTLGQRLGKVHLTPAQGAAAETVSAVLIGLSGFSGLPVSTTHIVTSGIAGTMVISGADLHFPMLSRIVIAWLVTLPVTILIAGGLYYLFESPTAILFK